MSVDLYYLPVSAPCRAVLLTAKGAGVKVNTKILNVLEGDQMKPEFLALNPEHVIPTMVDGDFVLWESRSICTYLVSQYGKDDSMYPKDPKTRAKIDRLLYFDMGTLYSRFASYVMPLLFGNETSLDSGKLEKIHEALGFLDKALQGHTWAVGDRITVADHVLAATVGTLEAIDIDLSMHGNVAAWLAKCRSDMAGYIEINENPAKEFGAMVKSKLNG